MAEQQQDNQLQLILSDLGTRIRDLEERNNTNKERILLIGQNLISLKEELDNKISEIEKQNNQILMDAKKIKSVFSDISSELNNFVRKDEIILIERMLKDFQPLDFVRRKDLEEMQENVFKEEKASKKEEVKNDNNR